MYLEQQGTQVVGVDVFIAQKEMPRFQNKFTDLELKSISNRGTQVWPADDVRFELCDVYQCRFVATQGTLTQARIIQLLSEIHALGLEFVHVEKLLKVNGKAGFSESAGA